MDLQGYMGTSTRLHQYIYYSVKKAFFNKVNHIKQDLSSVVEMSIRHYYLRKGLKQIAINLNR